MKDLKPNIKFNYLYRDAANYKNFGSVVFANPDQIEIRLLQNKIKDSLIEGDYFIPRKVNIPDLFYETPYDSENVWHEFESLEITSEKPETDITIKDFVDLFH